MTKYRVFTGRPWKRNPAYPQGWEPYGGAPKRTVVRGLSYDEAKRRCEAENKGKDRSVHGQTFHELEAQS
jgi:hypothetical protein